MHLAPLNGSLILDIRVVQLLRPINSIALQHSFIHQSERHGVKTLISNQDIARY